NQSPFAVRSRRTITSMPSASACSQGSYARPLGKFGLVAAHFWVGVRGAALTGQFLLGHLCRRLAAAMLRDANDALRRLTLLLRQFFQGVFKHLRWGDSDGLRQDHEVGGGDGCPPAQLLLQRPDRHVGALGDLLLSEALA